MEYSEITSETNSVIKFNLLDEVSIYYLFSGVGSELSNVSPYVGICDRYLGYPLIVPFSSFVLLPLESNGKAIKNIVKEDLEFFLEYKCPVYDYGKNRDIKISRLKNFIKENIDYVSGIVSNKILTVFDK